MDPARVDPLNEFIAQRTAEGGAPVIWAWHRPADGTATAPDGLTRAIIRNG